VSRVYAVEEGTGRRFLLRIECDGSGCSKSIAPRPDIAESGWVKRMQDDGPGTDKLRWDFCPDCAVRGT
jgi:hypothetical protein